MIDVVSDPFVLLSLAGTAAGIVFATLLRRIERSRRPTRLRSRRRYIVPLAATLTVACIGIAGVLAAATIIKYWVAGVLVLFVPFVLVLGAGLLPYRMVRILILLLPLGAIALGVLRGVPAGAVYRGDSLVLGITNAEMGDRGRSSAEDLAVLLVERRGDALALRLLPVRGAPFIPPDADGSTVGDGSAIPARLPTEYRIPLDGRVRLTAEVLVRPAPLWFLGPRMLVQSLAIDGGPRLDRVRAVSGVVVAIEAGLTPSIFQLRSVSLTLPEVLGEYLQEGPIALNATAL